MSFVISVGGLNLSSMMERKLFECGTVSVSEVAGFGRIWSSPFTSSGRLGISRRLSSSCQGSDLSKIKKKKFSFHVLWCI